MRQIFRGQAKTTLMAKQPWARGKLRTETSVYAKENNLAEREMQENVRKIQDPGREG